MVWANVQRDEYKLAEMALDQLILENLRFPQFQQIYFLRIIVAVGEGEKQKEAKDGTFNNTEIVSNTLKYKKNCSIIWHRTV